MSIILNNIKALCLQKGISLRQLEHACGLSPRYVYKWDTATPGVDKVAAIADYFGISIDELIGREVKDQISLEDRRILAMFDGLNQEGRLAAMKQLEFIAAQPEYIKSDSFEQLENAE